LLTIFFNRSTPANPSLASFHVELPTEHPNFSPSRTLFIRRAISSVIVPVGLFVNEIFGNFLSYPIIIIFTVAQVLFNIVIFYVLLVLACWVSRRCPPFWPWTRTFLLTKTVVTYLGPRPASVTEDVEDNESACEKDKTGNENEAESVGGQDSLLGPKPLRSTWEFFTSSSPLDDLFATFEATRPFVQPLSFKWRQSRPEDDENRTVTVSPTEAQGGVKPSIQDSLDIEFKKDDET